MKYVRLVEDTNEVRSEVERCGEDLLDNCYRYGSEKFFQVFSEARKMGISHWILETDIGSFGSYEGESVPLDLPMIESEETTDLTEQENEPKNPELWKKAIAKAKQKFDVYPSAYANAWAAKWYKEQGGKWQKKVDEGKKGLDSKSVYPDSGLGKWAKQDWVDVSRKEDDGSHPSCGRDDADKGAYPKCRPAKSAGKLSDKQKKSAVRRKRDAENADKDRKKGDKPNMVKTKVKESKDKDVELNEPQRGGPKKFFVYVKDGDKIKKVTFGDTTGLKVKFDDEEARKSFVARHDCENKKDKTKAGYWSCRLPMYAKQLGLSNGGDFFW